MTKLLGSTSYETARADAQTMANALGRECGVERMVAGRGMSGRVIWYRAIALPEPQYRQGAELMCEVVAPVEAHSGRGA